MSDGQVSYVVRTVRCFESIDVRIPISRPMPMEESVGISRGSPLMYQSGTPSCINYNLTDITEILQSPDSRLPGDEMVGIYWSGKSRCCDTDDDDDDDKVVED